jgi:heptaprenyl diphosphate synthase
VTDENVRSFSDARLDDAVLENDLATVHTWLRDYVSRPAPAMGRTGPVCPFVPPALSAGAMRFRFHYGLDGLDKAVLTALVTESLHEFQMTTDPPGRSGSSLASALIVLPDAVPGGWKVIDDVYAELKELAVQLGLMIGQFHPACDERSVRNGLFAVSRSPVALFAVRHMAVHDVLFLHGQSSWFEAYHLRFARHFQDGRVRDPLMRDLFAEAGHRFGVLPLEESHA